MRVLAVGLVALVVGMQSSLALAWDDFGHMAVAAVAYNHLTDAAKARVSSLLKLNPNYAEWVTGMPEDSQDEIAFMKAATWPDFIKHAPGYSSAGDVPSAATANLNVGYTDKLTHSYWHYINRPFSPDNTPLLAAAAPNVQTQITAFRQRLADGDTSDPLKSYDLVWLIHLVGDVHQPLHTTARFTRDLPEGDRGGNGVALCAEPCRSELHAFWDDVLGKGHQPLKVITFANGLAAPDAKRAAISDESLWVAEGVELAKSAVYIAPIGIGAGPFSVDLAYRANARDVARAQVALAGVRLANLINLELK